MKIKEHRQLKQGDTIKWVTRMEGVSREEYLAAHEKKIMNELVVMEVYPHHVLFRMLKYPYHKICITNNELYQKGIYKNTDFIKPFAR